ncbi:MAG TPA: hypothetical protein VHQ86_02755, partial [Candidatus Saccharimonadia bacterium]|nr:hypothetical protein [Candidatus Saccharimonadia bacterium]
ASLETSTSNFAGNQYNFIQSNTGAAGNLLLTNAGTLPALDVVSTASIGVRAVSGSGSGSSTVAPLAVTANASAAVFGYNNAAGAATNTYYGIQGVSVQTVSAAYSSVGVLGAVSSKGGTSAYAGYFTVNDTAATATAGAVLASIVTIQPASSAAGGTPALDALKVQGGTGGDTTNTGGAAGGAGADIILTAGNGGTQQSTTGNGDGGSGGNITLQGGTGGSDKSGGNVGTGGVVSIIGGSAGPMPVSLNSTVLPGANVSITGGTGSAGSGGSANGGGGDVLLQGGSHGVGGTGANGTSGSVIVRAHTGESTTAFMIQNNAGTATLFSADTLNSNVTVLGNNDFALGSWATTTALTTSGAARLGAATVTANGYIYVLGGATDGGVTNVNTVYYAKVNADGTVGTWNVNSNVLPYSAYRASAVTANGYIYYMGGYNGTNTISSAAYARLNPDGSVGPWISFTLDTPHSSAGAIYLNGYIYLVGGYNNTAVVATTSYAKAYADGSLGKMTTTTGSMALARYRPAVVAANGFIYAIGGQLTTTYTSADKTVYYAAPNPLTGDIASWTDPGSTFYLPANRTLGTAVVANGYMYYMGGTDGTTIGTNIYYSDLSNAGTFTAWNNFTTNPIPDTGRIDATAAVINGYVYQIGGSKALPASEAAQATVYVSSTSRLKVGGSLDLVGIQAGNLANQGDPTVGSGAGALTAGNGTFVGNLQVQGQAMINQGLTVGGPLTVNGSVMAVGDVPTGEKGHANSNTASGPVAIAMQGKYAYVAVNSATNDGIEVYDMSNPAAPQYVGGNVAAAANQNPISIAVQGHYAYVVFTGIGQGMAIYDISNPQSPSQVGLSSLGAAAPTGVYVQGRYAYVLLPNALVIIDISNPTAEVMMNGSSGTTLNGTNAKGIYVEGKYAYITETSTGPGQIEVVDISNPASPTVNVSHAATGTAPVGIYVQGRYAYVVNSTSATLQIFDTKTPSAIASVATVATGTLPQSVWVQGRYAYVTNTTSGTLQIFDVSTPASPVSLGTASTATTPMGVVAQGRYAYVATTAGGSGGGTVQAFDLGGSYFQQLEAGGVEAGTLAIDGDASINGDASVQGGMNLGQSLFAAGDISLKGILRLGNTTGATDPSGGVAGAMYYNSTMDEFRCYRGANWENCGLNPIDRGFILEDDFVSGTTTTGQVGALGWNWSPSGTAGVLTYNNTTAGSATNADHPGNIRIASNAATFASTGGSVWLGGNATTGTMFPGSGMVLKATVSMSAIATTGLVMRVGLDAQTTGTAASTSGVWWEFDQTTRGNNHWWLCSANVAAAACVDSGVTAVANTYARLELRINSSTSATGLVNGTSVASTNAIDISSVRTNPAINCFNTATATAQNACNIDYFQLRGVSQSGAR